MEVKLMKIIGLTGGSGTGKGTVAARMRALGAGWVDADAVYRTLCAENREMLSALDTACHEFDLAVPMWLDSTIDSFRRHDKARFYQDNFIEQTDFDFLEIHVIEED